MNKHQLGFAAVVLIAGLAISTASGAGFTDLGANTSSTGITADGTVVALTVNGTDAAIWTESGGVIPIGAGYTTAGAAFFGSQLLVGGNSGGNAYRWLGDTSGVGSWLQLPLSGGLRSWTALCTGASASDFWIAGHEGSVTGQKKALRYKYSSNSATTIQLPPNGNADSYFYGASNVGTFAGRYQYGGVSPSGSRQAMMSTGLPLKTLVGPPSTSNEAVATCISRDGTKAGGWSESLTALRGCVIWPKPLDSSSPTDPVEIALLPGDNYGETQALNANGSIAAGYSYYEAGATGDGPKHCWIWEAGGTRNIAEILSGAGVDLTGWTLTEVKGMSGDGTIVTGNGIYGGVTHAWVATIPPKRVVAASNKAVGDAVMSTAKSNFVFVLFGIVWQENFIDMTEFVMDDGSGLPIRVVAPGNNVIPGQYVRAKGSLDPGAVPPVIHCAAEDVWYY